MNKLFLLFKENLALNKLLSKIRKQREDLNIQTNSKLNVSAMVETGCKKTEAECTNLWSPNSSQNQDSSNNKRDGKSVDLDLSTNESDKTLTNASSSESVSSTSSVLTGVDNQPDGKRRETAKKLIRGIMMSSHNVSSLHEIETRFRLSRRHAR